MFSYTDFRVNKFVQKLDVTSSLIVLPWVKFCKMPLIGKGNIFLVHFMQACGSVRVQLHPFLNSVVDGYDCLAPRTSGFVLQDTKPLSNKQ
jgi:hypothetical protein